MAHLREFEGARRGSHCGASIFLLEKPDFSNIYAILGLAVCDAIEIIRLMGTGSNGDVKAKARECVSSIFFEISGLEKFLSYPPKSK